MNIDDSYDVVVVGGGPGGVCAAAAAAKNGAKTLLVERYGFLGGMATAGMVNPFMPYRANNKVLSSDIFNEILQRLTEAGGLDQDKHTFDDEILKHVLDDMMAAYNVHVLLHTSLIGVEMNGSAIRKAVFHNKSGKWKISARIFIDSTGDGDLAAEADADFEIGRKEDGACQPLTLCFRIAGITGNSTVQELRKELTEIYTRAKACGEIDLPREDVLLFKTLAPGVFHFNTSRVIGKVAIDAFHLTDAEIIARRQVRDLLRIFVKHSPRFADSYIVKTAAQIGVRETRRITGLYSMTEEDILECRKFDDGIARSNYPIDIHNPCGSGTVLKHLPSHDYYEIPYRCIVAKNIDNLLIGSRCISSTHEAHSSLRVMPVVAGLGEAAGIAAAIAAEESVLPAIIDGSELKRLLFSTSDTRAANIAASN